MNKRIVSLLLAVVMTLSLLTTAFAVESGFAQTAPEATMSGPVELAASNNTQSVEPQLKAEEPKEETDPVEAGEPEEPAELSDVEVVDRASESEAAIKPTADDLVTFIVSLDETPLLETFSTQEIVAGTQAVQEHKNEQEASINALKAAVETVIAGDEASEIGYSYTIVDTAISVTTTYGNKEKLEALPGVSRVYLAPTFHVPTTVDADSVKAMTYNSSTMVGADVLNESGYTGVGMRVAILDTGIEVDHPNFKALSDEKLSATSLTVAEIEGVWENLNASQANIRPSDAYHSSKIPYAINYNNLSAVGATDVSHNTAGSDHGTHVAGIAAANKVEGSTVTGVAPDAQVIVMQVFSDNGASWDTIMAALEDCVQLNVDSVNLSLGSAAGFTDNDPAMKAVFELFKQTDIEVLIAAGNDTNSSYGNATGLNQNPSAFPDTGLAGTPSTYTAAISVASIDNDGEDLVYFTVNGEKIGFRDTATGSNSLLGRLAEQTLEFVFIDGFGVASDYEGINVTGKVAVVSRGGSSFPDKQAMAQSNGAIACIVYNNVAGVINMQINSGDDHIPCVSVSNSAGKYMKEQYASGVNTLTVGKAGDLNHFKMDKVVSDFSSWGVTPDLKLKPEVSGVGGNIYSTVSPSFTGQGGYYGSMSGTSMATPQVTGAMAVLLQYMRDENNADRFGGLSEIEMRHMATNLMLSTANPVVFNATTGVEYSPRAQGAGLIDLVKATTTGAYLSSPVTDEGRPKGEFGDDDNKTGVYEFPFEINNISDTELTYTLDASVMTEALENGGYIANKPYALGAEVTFALAGGSSSGTQALCYDFNHDGEITTADARVLLRYINGSYALTDDELAYADINSDGSIDEADVQIITDYCAELPVSVNMLATYTVNGSADALTEVTVPAGEKVTVDVTITLTADDKTYMNQFENGIYVEGFIYVNGASGEVVDLAMPFVGFYGDWSAAPVWDSTDPEKAILYPQYIYKLNNTLIGTNPYIKGGKAGDEYNAISAASPLDEIDYAMLRNAKKLLFTVVNKATGEEYWRIDGVDLPKSYFSSSYGMVIPFYVLRSEGDVWDGTDKNGEFVPDNTRVIYTCQSWLDDGDDVMDEEWSFEVTVDNQYPEILNRDALQVVKGGTDAAPKVLLPLELQDNQYIAAVLFVNEAGVIMGKYEVDNTPNESIEQTYDITGYGNTFTIVVADYAGNETELDVILDLGDLSTVVPTITELETGNLYACEISRDVTAVAPGWITADKTDLSGLSNVVADTAIYYAADYINGYVMALRTDGKLVLLTPYETYWDSNILADLGEPTEPGSTVLYDLAVDYSYTLGEYDYVTGGLYAVGWEYESDASDPNYNGYNALYKFGCSVSSGDLYVDMVGPLTGLVGAGEVLTLGCTTDGQLYGIDTEGYLYKINAETAECEMIALTSFATDYGVPNTIQAMTFDHESQQMYWAAHNQVSLNGNATVTSRIVTVDLETGECTQVGDASAYEGWNGSGATSMFIPTDLESVLFTMGGDPTGVSVSPYDTIMATGQRLKMEVSWTPWTAQPQPITWASSDENVVTVDGLGVVTAVSEGEAEVTATTQVYDQWGYDTSDGNPGWYTKIVRCSITVVPSAEEIYGFVVADYKKAGNDLTWFKYSDQDLKTMEKVTSPKVPVQAEDGSMVLADALWQGGAYWQGYVYTVQYESWQIDNVLYSGTALYKCKVDADAVPAIGEPEFVGRSSGIEVIGMGFDYNTGRMYGSTGTGLCVVDLETGSVDRLCDYSGSNWPTGETAGIALCVTNEGVVIIADMDGNLHTVDPDTGKTSIIASINADTWYYGALCYDYNTGNIYWNPCMMADESPMYMVILGYDEWDPERMVATCIDIGDLSTKAGTQQTIMFTIPENEPETHYIPVEGISLDGDDIIGLVGGSYKASATTTPVRPTVQRKVWTTGDDAVATVDNLGLVSFVGVGTTTLTVSLTDKDGSVYSDTINITVKESAGKLVGFVTEDAVTLHGNNYVNIYDYAVQAAEITTYVTSMYTLNVGEYVDGYYYGYEQDGDFIRASASDPKSYTILGKVTELEQDEYSDSFDYVVNMAYDYKNSRMLAITQKQKLAEVNLDNGALTILAELGGDDVFTLSVDMAGKMYAAGGNKLYEIDDWTYETYEILELGGVNINTYAYYGANFTPQMAYEATTNRLYINATSRAGNSGTNYGMLMVDLETREVINLGRPALDRGLQATKVGDMFMGMLSTIPDASEIPEASVNGVEISDNIIRIALNDTYALEAHVRPTFAVDQEIAWSSSNESVATVVDGVVTGVAAGTATITATNPGSGKYAECQVTVINLDELGDVVAYTVSADQTALLKFHPEMPGKTEVVFEFKDGSAIGGLTVGDNCLYFTRSTGYWPGLYRLDLQTAQAVWLGDLYCYSGETSDIYYDMENDYLYTVDGYYVKKFDMQTMVNTELNYPKIEVDTSNLYGYDANGNYFSEFYSQNAGVVYLDGAVYTVANNTYAGTILGKYTDVDQTGDLLKTSCYTRVAVIDGISVQDDACAFDYCEATGLFYVLDASGFLWSFDINGENLTKIGALGAGWDFNGLAIVNP